MDTSEILLGIPLFAHVLEPEEITALAAASEVREYPAGTILVRQEDPGSSMFIVVSGTLAVSVKDRADEIPIATLTAGQIVGEMSLLTGLPRLATVTAKDDVRAIEIARDMIRPILTASPKLYDRFAALLQKRQGDLDQILETEFWKEHGRSRENLSKAMRRYFDGKPD